MGETGKGHRVALKVRCHGQVRLRGGQFGIELRVERLLDFGAEF